MDTSVFVFVLTSSATGLVHRRLTLTSTDVPSVISIVKNDTASINCFFNNHWNPSGLELWQKYFFISSKSFYSLYITEAWTYMMNFFQQSWLWTLRIQIVFCQVSLPILLNFWIPVLQLLFTVWCCSLLVSVLIELSLSWDITLSSIRLYNLPLFNC